MKCLHIYATPDGECHFGEVDMVMTTTPLFPNEAPFELSAYYAASRVRFVHIPAGVREAGFHTPPDRLLAVWLDGTVEFETSDGEVRRLPAGKGRACRGYAWEGTYLATSTRRAKFYFDYTAKRSGRGFRLVGRNGRVRGEQSCLKSRPSSC